MPIFRKYNDSLPTPSAPPLSACDEVRLNAKEQMAGNVSQVATPALSVQQPKSGATNECLDNKDVVDLSDKVKEWTKTLQEDGKTLLNNYSYLILLDALLCKNTIIATTLFISYIAINTGLILLTIHISGIFFPLFFLTGVPWFLFHGSKAVGDMGWHWGRYKDEKEQNKTIKRITRDAIEKLAKYETNEQHSFPLAVHNIAKEANCTTKLSARNLYDIYRLTLGLSDTDPATLTREKTKIVDELKKLQKEADLVKQQREAEMEKQRLQLEAEAAKAKAEQAAELARINAEKEKQRQLLQSNQAILWDAA